MFFVFFFIKRSQDFKFVSKETLSNVLALNGSENFVKISDSCSSSSRVVVVP